MKRLSNLAMLLVVLLAGTGLTACGGGGGGSPAPTAVSTGILVDSAVSGIRYKTDSQSGITDSFGSFQFRAGETVEFYIGDILIGKASGRTVLTPVDFVAGASDESHPQVTNIARFLQSLDDDSDPSNGINITEAVRNAAASQSLDFSLPETDFSTAAAALMSVLVTDGRSMVDAAAAREHFKSSLLGLFVGTYAGTYGGDSSGSWCFVVTDTGALYGQSTGVDDFGDPVMLSLSGTVKSDGTAAVGLAGSTVLFEGAFSAQGRIDGSWVDSTENVSGTFTGSTGTCALAKPARLARVTGQK